MLPNVLLPLLLAFVPCPQQAGELPPLDPALQSGIARLLEVEGETQLRESLRALRRMGGDELLVPQLFLFAQRATSTREAMLPAFVLAELPVPAEGVVRALVPLLENPEREVRRALGGVLSEYEPRSIERGADFSVYAPFLAGPDLPLGLVGYLCETDPDAALLALLRTQVREPSEVRALLWAQHEVADVRWKLRHAFVAREELAREEPEGLRQLDFLSRHARWWARLYAAEVAHQEPALRDAVALEELARDPHPLVRRAARGEVPSAPEAPR